MAILVFTEILAPLYKFTLSQTSFTEKILNVCYVFANELLVGMAYDGTV